MITEVKNNTQSDNIIRSYWS